MGKKIRDIKIPGYTQSTDVSDIIHTKIMKALYTLEEMHKYCKDIETFEGLASRPHSVKVQQQYQDALHVMREVLIRITEHIEQNGVRRPSLWNMFVERLQSVSL